MEMDQKAYMSTENGMAGIDIIDGGVELTPEEDYHDFRVKPHQETTNPLEPLVEIFDCDNYVPKDTTNKNSNKQGTNIKSSDADDSDDDVQIVAVIENVNAQVHLRKNKRKKIAIPQNNKVQLVDVKKNKGLVGIKVKWSSEDSKQSTIKEKIKNKNKSKVKTSSTTKVKAANNTVVGHLKIKKEILNEIRKQNNLTNNMTDDHVNNINDQHSLSCKLKLVPPKILMKISKNNECDSNTTDIHPTLPSENLQALHQKIPGQDNASKNKETVKATTYNKNIKDTSDTSNSSKCSMSITKEENDLLSTKHNKDCIEANNLNESQNQTFHNTSISQERKIRIDSKDSSEKIKTWGLAIKYKNMVLSQLTINRVLNSLDIESEENMSIQSPTIGNNGTSYEPKIDKAIEANAQIVNSSPSKASLSKLARIIVDTIPLKSNTNKQINFNKNDDTYISPNTKQLLSLATDSKEYQSIIRKNKDLVIRKINIQTPLNTEPQNSTFKRDVMVNIEETEEISHVTDRNVEPSTKSSICTISGPSSVTITPIRSLKRSYDNSVGNNGKKRNSH